SMVQTELSYGDGKSDVGTHFSLLAFSSDVILGANHIYSEAGNFTPTTRSFNRVSEKLASLPNPIVVQRPVVDFQVSVNVGQYNGNTVAYPIGETIYTITATGYPTDPFCKFTHADGTVETVYAGALMDNQPFLHTYLHGPEIIGDVSTSINCSNYISHVVKTVDFTVVQIIENVTIASDVNVTHTTGGVQFTL
ncbi:unnamed protein product, partial [Owenia fusiformis]